MLKTGLTVAAAAAGVLLPATAASAWTVAYENGIVDQIQISASAGESNEMALTPVAKSLRIVDAGGASKALVPCLKSAANGADCPFGAPEIGISISLGDKSDIALLPDVLGNATTIGIDGGAGDDRFGNGNAAGVLSAADGDDVIWPGHGTDKVLGGSGLDVAFYADRTQPMRADLGGGDVSGEAGEHDTLESVEAVITGAGDDQLVGTDAAEGFRGGAGRDQIDARGGADEITVQDGYRDTVDCGEGADTVKADQLDVLVGCEGLDVAFVAPVEPVAPAVSAPEPPAPAVAPPPVPAPAPTLDRTQPTLRGLKVTRRRGTATVRFTLSERAKVAVTIERCRTAKRCRKVKTVRRPGRRGANALRVAAGSGRLRVKLVATDAAGNRSRTAMLGFGGRP